MQVPWKPRDLADNFIVFRRRLGRTETYVEDLRVRKNFVRRVLTLLMERGFYRPGQGEQCRHMYYSTCDLAESNIEELPEDDVPGDLHFRDIDEQLPTGNVTRQMFTDWLTFGRHDCDVARSLGYAWTEHLKGTDEETPGDFFDRLCIERVESEAKAKADSDDTDENEEEPIIEDELPVPWIAKFFTEVFEMETAPFKVDGTTPEEILIALAEKIAQEMQSVDGVRGHVAC